MKLLKCFQKLFHQKAENEKIKQLLLHKIEGQYSKFHGKRIQELTYPEFEMIVLNPYYQKNLSFYDKQIMLSLLLDYRPFRNLLFQITDWGQPTQ